MYIGLEIYWKERLKQGKFILEDIKASLQKAHYVDNAITEEEYINLLAYAEDHVDPNYKPNLTLNELEEQNKLLKEVIEKLNTLLEQQVAVNKQQDDMIIEIIESTIKMEG